MSNQNGSKQPHSARLGGPPSPGAGPGAWLDFQKASSFSKVPDVSADRLTDGYCWTDLKGYLTKEVIKALRDQCSALCIFCPVINIPTAPLLQLDAAKHTTGAALASSGFPFLSPCPAETPWLPILTAASKGAESAAQAKSCRSISSEGFAEGAPHLCRRDSTHLPTACCSPRPLLPPQSDPVPQKQRPAPTGPFPLTPTQVWLSPYSKK